jgi:hypothetical protein
MCTRFWLKDLNERNRLEDLDIGEGGNIARTCCPATWPTRACALQDGYVKLCALLQVH